LTASQILEYGEFAYDFLKDLWGLYQSLSDVWREWGEVFRERAVEKAKYADAEEKKKIEAIDAEEAAAKQKAADAAAAEIARIDKEQQEGKCTKEEADKMRADVEAEAAKKTADAEAKAAKGRSDAKAETEKIKAEADGIKARQAADDEAESAKTAADTEVEEAKTKADEDAAFLLVNTMETILSITSEVYAVVEECNADNDDFDGDMFSLCTLAIDNGIITLVSGLLAATFTTRESSLSLGSNGSVTIEAQSFINATTTQATEVESPTPAFKQVSLVAQTVKLVPEISAFIRDAVTSIQGFVEDAKETEDEMEEL
jgi:hypothetical protein